MPEARTATEARLEVLNDAYSAWVRTWVKLATDPRAAIRATNRLLDACIDAGMAHDEPDHEAWAAERVTRWLCEA